MATFNQSRKTLVQLLFAAIFLIIVMRLLMLQVFTSKYKIAGDDQSIERKVIYPERGIIYDRNKNVLLQNTTTFNLMVQPDKLKGADTGFILQVIGMDTAEFKKRIKKGIEKNKMHKPSLFASYLTNEQRAILEENAFRISPGFFLQEKPVREYPYDAGGNVLGYISEVDTNFLKKHAGEGYQVGDDAGKAGLERSYEKVLMGERGIEYWKKDKNGKLTEKLENGKFDTVATAGQNMHTSLDIELQELGEKLMQNKLGSVVAIDPKTGGILCLVSSPGFKPSLITGKDRKKHIGELIMNPARPMYNRAVSAIYAPGSTFKTLQALIGMHEEVINTQTAFSCGGAFYGCGSRKPMRCLDYGTFSLRSAITVSDNTYFANVMQRVINNPKYPNIDSSLSAWNEWMYGFGLGRKLGVDLPFENNGMIPTPAYYNKTYGAGKWNFCSFRSVSIGQGEVTVTPLQAANEMVFIANKGWFYTPHLVDSIEGGDKFNMLGKFKEKRRTIEITDSIFEAVHDGMEGVVQSGHGTGVKARVKGITICGKTGTVENYYRGVKQPNHAFFCAFAPRENPKIAIMCVVENSGRFGGTYAAPIAGLMIEKYLKDSIESRGRKAQVESMSKLNLIPSRIYKELRYQDSLFHAGDSAYLLLKGYITLAKDSSNIEDEDEKDLIEDMKKTPEKKPAVIKTPLPKKDSGENKPVIKPEAILPDKKKIPEPKDSVLP